LWYTQYTKGMSQLCRQVYRARNNCFHMAGRPLSGLSPEVTPHVHGFGFAPMLSDCKGVGDVQWAAELHLGLARTWAAE